MENLRGSTLRLLGLLALTLLVGSTQAGDLRIQAGMGYDFLSQSFRVDTLVDALDASLSQNSIYLDDMKGSLRLEYAPGASRSMLLMSLFEQSASETRFQFTADARKQFGSVGVSSLNEFDWHHRPNDSSSGSPYWYGSTRNQISLPLGGKTTLKGQIKGDMARFSQPSQYRLNYYRYGGKFGLRQSLGGFSALSLRFFANSREVPDSAAWAYNDYGLESDIYWFHARGEFSLYARIERKDYNQPDEADDYDRYEMQLASRLSFGNALSGKFLADYEDISYAAVDDLNYDYRRSGFEILVGYESIFAGFWLGPEAVWLTEQNNGLVSDYDLLGGQSYREIGLKAELDFLNQGLGFFSVENSIGRRTMTSANPAESDFTFERVSLLADARLFGALRLNLMISADWEFHEDQSEDNRIFLISSGLNWTF